MAFNSISKKSPEYFERIDQWRKVRDVIEGEEEVKDESTEYLPKPKGQDTEQYQRYLERAVFYGVSERTIRNLVGLVFRIDPAVELPDALEGMVESASSDGSPLDTVVQDALREVLSVGRYGLLVDMPTTPSLTGEAIPYVAPYIAENIWRWEEVFDPVTGRRVLVRVVLKEEPNTAGDETVTWLRELFLDPETGVYVQQLWIRQEAETRGQRESAAKEDEEFRETDSFQRHEDPIAPLMNGEPLRFIPFFFVNTFNLTATPDKPPMLDLADMNIAHYRNSADYEQCLHLVAQPTPWIAADWEESEKPVHIGSGTLWKLGKDAQVGMLEFSGSGVDAIRTAMEDKEQRMAALGARLIRDQERPNVTAETTRLQSRAEESVLTSGTKNVEAAINRALRLAAEWAGAGESEVEDLRYELNRDFVEASLSAQELTALVAGWQSGAYSQQTLWENLQRGEVADPKRTLDEEKELIEQEAPDVPPGTQDLGDATQNLGNSDGSTELVAGGSIEATGTTGPGGAGDHVHAFELRIEDDGTITGRALAGNDPNSAHEHDIRRLDRTGSASEPSTHAHSLPLGGQRG